MAKAQASLEMLLSLACLLFALGILLGAARDFAAKANESGIAGSHQLEVEMLAFAIDFHGADGRLVKDDDLVMLNTSFANCSFIGNRVACENLSAETIVNNSIGPDGGGYGWFDSIPG